MRCEDTDGSVSISRDIGAAKSPLFLKKDRGLGEGKNFFSREKKFFPSPKFLCQITGFAVDDGTADTEIVVQQDKVGEIAGFDSAAVKEFKGQCC